VKKCFLSIFISDATGETTLEIVKLMSTLIKAKAYNVRPEVNNF
jgi:hypothetical protein